MTKPDGYSEKTFLKRVPKETLSMQMKHDFNFNHPLQGFYISTQVFGFLFWKKWVVALDCDSSEDRDRAIEELDSLEFKYDVIESSPYKFWIIVDYVGSFKKCINLMSAIPGVHTDFINKCAWEKKIVLRAFPKNGFIPRHVASPRIECHGKAGDWFYEFKKWWDQSGIVGWLAHQSNRGNVEMRVQTHPQYSPERGYYFDYVIERERTQVKQEEKKEIPKEIKKGRRVEFNWGD
jgi:hypothetical protein